MRTSRTVVFIEINVLIVDILKTGLMQDLSKLDSDKVRSLWF